MQKNGFPGGGDSTNIRRANAENGRSTFFKLVIAAIVALLAALLFYFQILGMPADVSQFSKYPIAALQYLNGTLVSERLLDFSPLYLDLHAAAYGFMADPLRSILWMHIILLSLTAMLLYLILRNHVGTILSLMGAAAFILGKSVVIFGYTLDPEPLMVFFLAAFVFFAERKSLLSGLAAGSSLSLSILTRPSFLPLALLLPLYYVLQFRSSRRAIIISAFFLAPVIVTLIFVGVRNYRLQGHFSPWFMSPGTVFFDGNNPLSLGVRAAYPPVVNDYAGQFKGESDYEHAVYRLFARTTTGKDLTPDEANKFWAAKASSFIIDYPVHFFSLSARRLFCLFHSHRWYDLNPAWSADRELQKRGFPFVPFAPLSALALLGMAVCSRSWRNYFLPYAVFMNQAVLMSLTYATDRQRVCLYPFFAFFAVMAISRLYSKRRGRLILIAAFVLLTLLFSVETNRMRDDKHIWEVTKQTEALTSETLRDMDDLDSADASKKSAQILALAPSTIESGRLSGIPVGPRGPVADAVSQLPSRKKETPSTKMDKAILFIEAGRLDEAGGILTELSREGYEFDVINRNPEPLYHLGRIAVLRGQPSEALRFMKEALLKRPGDPEILASLSCLSDENVYSDKLFRYYDKIDAYFFLGRECLRMDQPEKAVEYLSRVSDLLPDYTKGRIYLAAALGATGHYEEAVGMYLSAAGERPQMVILDNYILPAFKRWARDGSVEAAYWYGIMLRQYGYFPEAVQALKKAANAGYPGAKDEIANIDLFMGKTSGLK